MTARTGGSDIGSNFRLALAVEKARASNMPKDSIERAIKRGAGEDKDAAAFEEFTLEGYGPHGSAIMVDCVTDNRNRTVADMRHVFSKNGGTMAEAGAVGWQFERKAYFSFPASQLSYDKAFELAIEAGADDVQEDGENIEITGPVDVFKTLSVALHAAKVTPDESGLRLIAKQDLELDVDPTLQVLRVVEAIEEMDDVQNVYHNLKISDDALEALEAE